MEDALDYYKEVVFERYADFNGRSRRAEFWYFYMVHMLIIIGMAMIGPRINIGFYIVGIAVYTVLTVIPTLAVTIRRLHDTEKSGWWYFISFIPIVGSIILIVFLATEGTYGTNLYGEDPKEEEYYLEEHH